MNRTKVRIKEEFHMTGWTLFFVMLGVVSLTDQLFRVIDMIERPARRTRRRAMAR